MQYRSFARTILATVLGWTLIAMVITPIRAKALSKHLGSAPVEGVETDLISLLTGQARESQYLREAYTLVDELQSAPTCNQLAAYQLLTSCKGLEVGPDGTETPILLERVKNLYAARLAVCELESAHVSTPSQCKDIMSISLADLASAEVPRLNRLWYGQGCAETTVLKPCLEALHDKSTSWTSYSNNRAQAITMCHAIRDHLEREQTAETHRKLVKVVSKMTNETSEVSRFLSETQQRHAATHLETQDVFESFMADVRDEMDVFAQKGVEVIDLLSNIALSAASLETDLQTMSSKLQNASNNVEMVSKGVTNILQPVVEASSEISSHLVDMKDFVELAKPFLSKGTEVAHIVNDSWRQIQATHSALMNFVPTFGCFLFLGLIGRCLGMRKRDIFLTGSAILYAGYLLGQLKSRVKPAARSSVHLVAKASDYIRANIDILEATGLFIIAITFAVICCFWIDSLRQSRKEKIIKEKVQNLQRARRHDRHKNFAVDLGTPKHERNMDRDRFKRAGTAPPEIIKSEWV